MQVAITLKNYRCFPGNKPATISWAPGFTAFVGANNSGKSTVLKFFYEFRNLFDQLTNPDALLRGVRKENQKFNLATSVSDIEELFCNFNSLDIQIEICLKAPVKSVHEDSVVPNKITINVPRPTNSYTLEVAGPEILGGVDFATVNHGTVLVHNNGPSVEMTSSQSR